MNTEIRLATCTNCHRPSTSPASTRFDDWYHGYNREATCPTKLIFEGNWERNAAEKSCNMASLKAGLAMICHSCKRLAREVKIQRSFEYLDGTEVVILHVHDVPIWQCRNPLCGEIFADERSENMRKDAITRYLEGKNHKTLQAQLDEARAEVKRLTTILTGAATRPAWDSCFLIVRHQGVIAKLRLLPDNKWMPLIATNGFRADGMPVCATEAEAKAAAELACGLPRVK